MGDGAHASVLAVIAFVALFLLLLAQLTVGSKPVAIRLSPQVVMAGQAFWLTCRVEPHVNNRLLDYGVVNYREHSQRDLDGDKSPATYQVLVEHVPCGAGPAYCAVYRVQTGWARDERPILVGGCH